MRWIDFICVGAIKCGTTCVLTTLRQHPDIWMPDRETFFWGYRYKNPQSYHKLFQSRTEKLIGEKTPDVICNNVAMDHLYLKVPNAKLIVMLRDPVCRAWSHYQMLYQNGNIRNKDFFFAVDEATRILQNGHYAPQLRRLYTKFKKNQVWIGLLEHLKRNPTEFFHGLYKFLDVDPLEGTSTFLNPNEGVYTEMPPWIKDYLINYYKPYNKRLYNMLGVEQIEEWL